MQDEDNLEQEADQEQPGEADLDGGKEAHVPEAEYA